jgi:hypothetical protein
VAKVLGGALSLTGVALFFRVGKAAARTIHQRGDATKLQKLKVLGVGLTMLAGIILTSV